MLPSNISLIWALAWVRIIFDHIKTGTFSMASYKFDDFTID